MAANASFDYIIVGAGTAGCVVAGRLAEDPQARICVLEAGGSDRHPLISTPAMVAAAIATRRLNWRFETVPQAQLHGRRIPQPRGRVVGGSGSINGMVYSRGNPRDYDDWAAAGASGWDYASVLPYFVRSENNEDLPASLYHGRGGPLNVHRPRLPTGSAMISSRPRAAWDFRWPRTSPARIRRAWDCAGADSRRQARNHRPRLPATGAAAWQRDPAH